MKLARGKHVSSAVRSDPEVSFASSSTTSRNAMDNASKNASDMIGSLQMQYNRGRQASITNELVDIITGAYLPTSVQRPSLNTVLPQVQVRSEHGYWSRACDRIVEICVPMLYLPAAYGLLHLHTTSYHLLVFNRGGKTRREAR